VIAGDIEFEFCVKKCRVDWHPTRLDKPKRNDRKSGLILIAVAVGLYTFLATMGGLVGEEVASSVRWVALIPGLIGVALLINWAFERNDKSEGQS